MKKIIFAILLGGFLCVHQTHADQTMEQETAGLAEQNTLNNPENINEKCQKLREDCDNCQKDPKTIEAIKKGLWGPATCAIGPHIFQNIKTVETTKISLTNDFARGNF